MRVSLTPLAQACLNVFVENQSTLNGVSSDFISQGNMFNVVPKVEYRWLQGVQNASDFLKRITMDTCDEMIVNDLGYESSGLISGRTNTDNEDRKTKSLGSVKGVKYECVDIDHDTHITFKDLNRWSEYDKARFLDRINERREASKANDIVMIGWHGTKAAADTNVTENPLGQDVAIGWVQHVKTNKKENFLEDAITIGKDGDYKNLDAFVIAAKAQIPPHKRKDLVCLASPELVDIRNVGLAEIADVGETADQKVRLSQAYLSDGTEVLSPDFFPEKMVIITPLKNLHHLTKKGSTRITPETNSKRSRYELYQQSVETYAIGDYEQIIIFSNVASADAGTEGA